MVNFAALYRFEYGGEDIRDAVRTHCPEGDPRREVMPRAAELCGLEEPDRAGVCFWTGAGLERYVASGLQDWQRAVVPGEVRVRTARLRGEPLHADELRVVAPADSFCFEREETANAFFLRKSEGRLVEKVGMFVVRQSPRGRELLVFRHRH